MVYNNKVYDVSNWHDHPGGNVIFTHGGHDFTDIFSAFHPPDAKKLIDPFYIGELDASTDGKSTKQRDFEKGYRSLRAKLVQAGFFQAR